MRNDILSCFDYSKPLSLYIHIPFCTKKCNYCAFYSCPGVSSQEINSYTDKIVSEIKSVVSKMHTPFYTAYIGGGNPGCLGNEGLEKICAVVCANGRPVEFTTEMNPESLNFSMDSLFEKYFTRLSMGVQSLDEQALALLGRNASLKQTLDGIEKACILRKKTNIKLNFDLISCLPKFHDSLKDVTDMVQNFRPDHLSVYALTPEEGTKMWERRKTLPSSDEQYDILSEIWRYLASENYNHYEVSNFALKDSTCLHNTLYWNYGQYVGLGSNASSTAFKDGTTYRIEGEKNIHTISYNVTKLTNQESLEEFVLMGVRHTQGLDLERLYCQYGKKLKEIPQYYHIENSRLVPTEEALMLCDAVAYQILENFYWRNFQN